MRVLSPLRRVLVLLCVVLLMGLVFAGCLAPTQGTVVVYLKGQPSDEFVSFDLEVTRVEIQQAGAGIGDGPDPRVDRGAGEEPPPGQMGIRTISTSRTTLDMLEYQESGSRALLGSERVAEGPYSLLVIRLGNEAQGVLRSDGSTAEVTLTTREIRHSFDFPVEASETTRLVLEVDLDGSISRDAQGNLRMAPRVADVQVEPRAEGPEADTPDRGV